MSRIISIHSYRRGTGKSTLIVNIATILAQSGKRVCIVDTGFQSPSIHILFGINDADLHLVLNDHIAGRCDIEQASYDVTSVINHGSPIEGSLLIVPSNPTTAAISSITQQGYDVGVLNLALRDLITTLDLDVLMVDTHAGINEETLLSLAICDVMAMIFRLDKQDYQGTAVTLDLAAHLGVPDIKLIANEVPDSVDVRRLALDSEVSYGYHLSSVIPHSDRLMSLASREIFVVKYPDHPLTDIYRHLAGLLADG